MGKDGSMYVLTETHEQMDKFGHIVLGEMKIVEEGPPRVGMEGFCLVNSIWAQKVQIDDRTGSLYKQMDEEIKFFYIRSSIPVYMATESKGLYVYGGVLALVEQNMIMLDKYGLE